MSKKITDMVYIAIGTALLVVCSWMALPSAIPITMQTFAIFTVLGMLGGRNGNAAILIYVILGAMGLPVFSHFKGGLAIIFNDPAGGYIIGFIVMALVYWFAEIMFGKSLTVRIISMVIGLAVCYIIGTLWYVRLNLHVHVSVGFVSALTMCVTPFVIPDLAKLALSVLVVQKMKKHLSVIKR